MTEYMRNLSFTIAECSTYKKQYVKNLTILETQSHCRLWRRPILNISPAYEYVHNNKNAKFFDGPLDLSVWRDNSFGVVYMSDPFFSVDVESATKILEDAHRIAKGVFISSNEPADVGKWVGLSTQCTKPIYEHVDG